MAYPADPSEVEQTIFDIISKETGSQVVKSEHPYKDNENNVTMVYVEDAEAVEIAFSSRSATEDNYDYVTFLKSENGTEYYGRAKYCGGRGGTTKIFPGVGSEPTLIIPSNRFWVKFASDRFGPKKIHHARKN